MDTSKIVGEKIKALREDKSITIEELAQRSGLAIERSNVSKITLIFLLLRRLLKDRPRVGSSFGHFP